MKHYVCTEAICPYYRMEERQKLYCEGVEEGMTLHVAFGSPKMQERYKAGRCCSWAWADCRIARMLNQKWEEA